MHTLACFFSVLCTLPFASFAEANKNPSGFSIDLIHRDSPLSTLHDPSKTPLERIRNAALRTHSRMNRVINSLNSFSSSLNENQSPQHESIIIPNSGAGDYLMKIYIGTPPVERLVIADTGSDLNWVQCFPCRHCFPQGTPIYDPSKSSTFTNVPCDSQPCALLHQPQPQCGISETCIYTQSYSDNSFTVGELVFDSISFGNSTSGAVTFPEFVFGCGNHNEFTVDKSGIPTGIVGLGPGPFSLVSQLGDSIGRKFSYCLLPSVSTFNSKLKFGDKSMVLGNGVVSTPLFIKHSSFSYYYLNLEGVTVGTKTMKTGQITSGNMIIDSGTTLTYLEPSFYDEFVTSVKEAVGGVEVVQGEDVPHPFRFCFKHDKPDMDFPNTVFHFTGANITLKTSNLFLFFEEDSLICLAVVPTADDNASPVFGNLAQVDFQVEYDLDGKKVSFAPTDCTKN